MPGIIEVDANGDMESIKTRMLSPTARHIRVARMDNVKSPKLSWAEFEGLLTMPTISGRELYEGEGRSPNLMTWILTINGASLSTDIAQRVIPIQLDRPKPRPSSEGSWVESVKGYVAKHRWEIIADVIATLQTEVPAIKTFTRWATWERDILGRIGGPSGFEGCQPLILERQKAFNSDDVESDMMREFLAHKVKGMGHDPNTAHVLIPSDKVAEWVGEHLRKPMAPAQASRRLNQFSIPELSAHKDRRQRGKVWTGARFAGNRGDSPGDLAAYLVSPPDPP